MHYSYNKTTSACSSPKHMFCWSIFVQNWKKMLHKWCLILLAWICGMWCFLKAEMHNMTRRPIICSTHAGGVCVCVCVCVRARARVCVQWCAWCRIRADFLSLYERVCSPWCWNRRGRRCSCPNLYLSICRFWHVKKKKTSSCLPEPQPLTQLYRDIQRSYWSPEDSDVVMYLCETTGRCCVHAVSCLARTGAHHYECVRFGWGGCSWHWVVLDLSESMWLMGSSLSSYRWGPLLER